MRSLHTDVLVIGGGVGGTAAAIQAARRGVSVVLVSEFEWLGGMLTTAGVTAPDGNELLAWQTGLWGEFLRSLWQQQPGGLEQSWVSFFTYAPRTGAAILAQWVAALPQLTWIAGETPQVLLRQGDRVVGAEFNTVRVQATITLDGTELGDGLALGNIPHRWGWDQDAPPEPSLALAQTQLDLPTLQAQYPVQVPTWVVVLQDYGRAIAPVIPPPPDYQPARYEGAWANYGAETFLNYGRLPGDRFMLNWPHQGNDYGLGVERLVGTASDRAAYHQAAWQHSLGFAHFIQTTLGRRYGLATDSFPQAPHRLGGGAFALQPYYRESRRLIGQTTIWEPAILPQAGGRVASLPRDASGQVTAIAIGNYPNDHHYPGTAFPLTPKAIRWGGRWTGTPFTIPYPALVPAHIDGLLVCEKNISVSHIANGATRLQPLVMNIGQAAGLAAALCVEQGCQPRDLAVRSLQEALLTEPHAPQAVVPLFNCIPQQPDWLNWQRYYLDHPDQYPATGEVPVPAADPLDPAATPGRSQWQGTVYPTPDQGYQFVPDPEPETDLPGPIALVTLNAAIAQELAHLSQPQRVHIQGQWNRSGPWLNIETYRHLTSA